MKVRRNSIREKAAQTAINAASRRILRSLRGLKWILLGPLLSLLLIGTGLGAERTVPRWVSPYPLWSKVDYEPKLTDPFFKSNEWGRQCYRSSRGDTRCDDPGPEDAPVTGDRQVKRTAKCFSNSMGGGESMHLVRFCEAKLLAGLGVVLELHEDGPGHMDSLRVWIRNGMFTSRFRDRAASKRARLRPRRWTPKRQKLTLNKKTFRKGDVIKGRIDLECIEELGGHVGPVIFYGVFKTVVE
ncbi:hypothetical protein ACFL2Q_06860 [Thermodesulfobacteriota bacterium]